MADLSGVLGAERLVAIVAELACDPAGLTAAAAAFTDAGQQAESTGAVVAQQVGALDAAWQGRAADAVVGFGGSLRGAYETVLPAATAVAAACTSAADALTAARAAVVAVTDRVAAAVAAIEVTDGPSHDLAVLGIVGPATAEAEGHLGTCVAALSDATAQVAAQSAATPFTALPPVGDQPFQPGQLAPGDWSVQPPPEVPAGTSSQGAGGGAGGGTGGGTGASGGTTHGTGLAGSGGGGGGSASGGGGGGLGTSSFGSSGDDVGGRPPGGGGTPAAPEQVNRWIDEAIEILRREGVPVDQMSREDIWTIISHESGGNPNAINDWDSNAAAGTPSKGLMQTIGPTFESYKLPGHDDIWNPVDNIIAGVRYSIERYGSVSNVPGVTGVASGGGYVGY